MISKSFISSTSFPNRKVSHVCYGSRKNRGYDWRIYDEDENNNDKSYILFQSKNVPLKDNPLTINDVRDAVECCSGILNERMRNECYVQFGVDGNMAEKYYKHIVGMERQYEMPDDPIPTRDIKLNKKKNKWNIFKRE
jgi:hypothetical protein